MPPNHKLTGHAWKVVRGSRHSSPSHLISHSRETFTYLHPRFWRCLSFLKGWKMEGFSGWVPWHDASPWRENKAKENAWYPTSIIPETLAPKGKAPCQTASEQQQQQQPYLIAAVKSIIKSPTSHAYLAMIMKLWFYNFTGVLDNDVSVWKADLSLTVAWNSPLFKLIAGWWLSHPFEKTGVKMGILKKT